MLSRELLHVLARRGSIEIVRALKAYPDGDFTINELARVARVPAMTTWRAVQELRKVGFVRTRKVGNATSVRITEDKEKLRVLRLIPETDPQKTAAREFASRLGENEWLVECRLFGNIGRGEHSPGEEVDVAVVFDDSAVSEADARELTTRTAAATRAETNISIVPLLISRSEMARRGGLASELRDKETIWRR